MHQLDLDRNVYEGKYSIEMKKKKNFFFKRKGRNIPGGDNARAAGVSHKRCEAVAVLKGLQKPCREVGREVPDRAVSPGFEEPVFSRHQGKDVLTRGVSKGKEK